MTTELQLGSIYHGGQYYIATATLFDEEGKAVSIANPETVETINRAIRLILAKHPQALKAERIDKTGVIHAGGAVSTHKEKKTQAIFDAVIECIPKKSLVQMIHETDLMMGGD